MASGGQGDREEGGGVGSGSGGGGGGGPLAAAVDAGTAPPPEVAAKATALARFRPYLWAVAWVALNVLLTLLNKVMFSRVHFPYPMLLSAVHMLLCGALSAPLVHRLRCGPSAPLDAAAWQRLVGFSLLFTANIAAGNASLRYASISFTQVVRSLIPALTMAASWLLLGRRYAVPAWLSMALVALGVELAVEGDLYISGSGGLAVTLVGCVLAALKGVVTNILLTAAGIRLHPLYLLYVMAPLALVQMLLLAAATGEVSAIAADWQRATQPLTLLMLASSGVIAFALNYTNFMTTKATSAITLSVAGNLKQVITIALGWLLFEGGAAVISPIKVLGICVTVAGTGLYNYLEATGHASLRAPALLPGGAAGSSGKP